ncbi:MAG TPA: Fe-S oxidoreductase, partial [Verrucomicrobiales bacterium]|nr:Fe-S oxidoreductase [Verrucomicrobiales bacterium]
GMIREHYPRLFAGDVAWEGRARKLAERTCELTSFLVDVLGVTGVAASLAATVTYHDACSGLREMGVKAQPRRLLASVDGLTVKESAMAETCCGFGGTFATKFPMISTAMGEVKCASARETNAEYMISADSSCLMHLRGLLDHQKQPLKTLHLAEVLTAR